MQHNSYELNAFTPYGFKENWILSTKLPKWDLIWNTVVAMWLNGKTCSTRLLIW